MIGSVFLSYASADRDRALKIADALEAAGIPVWIDRRGIAGGTVWMEEIARALRESSAVLVLCSATSVQSRNVRQEVQLAWDQEKPILPLLLEPVDFPDGMAYALQGRQWIEINVESSSDWLSEAKRFLELPTASEEPVIEKFSEPKQPLAFDVPGNLPSSSTTLIGREVEVERVGALLIEEDVRLVTLTGPGGAGKTRVALEVSHRIRPEFPGGVWFVDLSHLTDADAVMPAIAQAMGIQVYSDSGVLERLASAIRTTPTLIVVDNFEQVVTSGSALKSLLAAAPKLRVLATSRTPLHLTGEHLVSIEPLRTPSVDRPVTVKQSMSYPAIRLFAERARAAKSAFELTPENLTFVIAICARLDGLPLAIELAAARVRLLAPKLLLARLGQGLDLIPGGMRDLPARQQTMRTTIAWSCDLLSPEEAVLFRRLSVFVGGCTIEAVEAVCDAGADFDTLAAMSALVDMNLVWLDDNGSEPRYRMLQVIREFSLERLTESGEREQMQRAFTSWCIEFSSEYRLPLSTSQSQDHLFARIDEEAINLRATIELLLSSGDYVSVLDVMYQISEYWGQRPGHSEVLEWNRIALESGSKEPSFGRFSALFFSVSLAEDPTFQVHDEAYVAEALEIAEALNDPMSLGQAHYARGLVAEYRGDAASAAECYKASLTNFELFPQSLWADWARSDLGDKLVVLGQVEQGIVLIDKSLLHFRGQEFEAGIAMAGLQRAYAAIAQRDTQSARRLLRECVEISTKHRDPRTLLGAAAAHSAIAIEMDQPDMAARILGAADAARSAAGIKRYAEVIHVRDIEGRAKELLGYRGYDELYALGREEDWEAVATEILRLIDVEPKTSSDE